MTKLIPKLRSLHRGELEESWELHRQGFPYIDVESKEDYLRPRAKPGFDFERIIVAEADGKIVGKIEVHSWISSGKAKRGYVDGFVVDAAYRRRGIGTKLMLEAERHATRKGMTHLELGAKAFNKEAIGLYRKLGYKELHRVSFMRISAEKLRISELPSDIHVRVADPQRDPEELIKIGQSVWWSEYGTKEALRLDVERNPKRFLVLEHKEEVQAYVKYNLGAEVNILSFGVSAKTTTPLPTLVRCLLARVLAEVKCEGVLYMEVDETENELLQALRSLGFETYETEFHMRKTISQ